MLEGKDKRARDEGRKGERWVGGGQAQKHKKNKGGRSIFSDLIVFPTRQLLPYSHSYII
jgi:hypothetical protein